MNFRHKITYGIILSALFLVSCNIKNKVLSSAKTTSKPTWTTEMKTSKYPESSYMQGVGFAKQENDSTGDGIMYQKNADSSAIATLAQQISLSIEGSSTDTQSETTINNKTTSSTYVELTTKLTVSLSELEGVTVKERYYDDKSKTYYSLAILERKKTSLSLKTDILKLKQRATEYFNNAESLFKINSISKALKSYLIAENELKNAYKKERIQRIISGRNSKLTIEEITIPQVEGKILDIISKLKIEKLSGDEQQGTLSEPLDDPFVIKVVYMDKLEKLSLESFPIIYSFKENEGNGIMAKEAYTNDSGVARTFVSQVKPSGVSRNIVDVRLDYSKFLNNHQSIMPLKAEFTYTLLTKSDIRVLLNITEKFNDNLRTNSIIEGELLKELKAADFNVVDKNSVRSDISNFENMSPTQIRKKLKTVCDVLIYGNIVSVKKSAVSGLIFAESMGTIKAVYIKKANILATLNIIPKRAGSNKGYNTQGAGLNLKKAVTDSLIKTSISISKDTVFEIEKSFNNGFKNNK